MFEHRLLQRQIRKHLAEGAEIPPGMEALLRAVEETYRQYDTDRKLVERAMEVSSNELFTANEQLRAQNIRDTEVLDRLRALARNLVGENSPACAAAVAADDGSDVLELSRVIEALIGQRNEAEARLRLALEEAQAANRAKSDFLATMSHEIRTPMNGVIGFTDLLLQSGLNEEQRRFTETLRRSGEALLTVINDILDFSKIEAGKLDFELMPCVAEEVVEEVITLVGPRAAEKGLRLEMRTTEEQAGAVMADPLRLRQILLNLAGNAVKFTARGHVLVDIGPASAIDGPWSSGVDPAAVQRETLFTVTDTGIGVPAEKLPHLFQKFMQADSSTTRKYGGTGLGLAIARRLVELMGGRIGVQSTPDEGSTFWFTIPNAGSIFEDAAPAAIESGTNPAPEDAPDAPRPGDGLRVLVADDNEINRAIAEEMLVRLGCTVDLVGSGVEVLERLKTTDYDLILMDCRMPDMDGFVATQEIRRREKSGRRTPVIALTANAIDGDRERCLESDMDDYVSKPVKLTDLARVVGRWRSAGEAARVG